MTELTLIWKNVRGKSGSLMSPVGRGSLIKENNLSAWYFLIGRGDCLSCTDYWGPLDSAFNDEISAVKAATKLEKQLERAGWFNLQHKVGEEWDNAKLDDCLIKLPRNVIPGYFLSGFDERQAASGKALSGAVLRIGGKDIHKWKSSSADAGMYLETDVTLILAPPGAKPSVSNKKTFWLKFGASGCEALIDYLFVVRAGLVTEETFQSAAREVSRELPGDFENVSSLRNRYQRMRQKSADINRLLTRLFSLSHANIATLFLVVAIMERGDRINGVSVSADDGSKEELVPIFDTSETEAAIALDEHTTSCQH